MDLNPASTNNDPEFGSHRAGLLAGTLDDEPEAYLRLVANPFLAFAYIVFWLILLYETVIGGFAGPLSPMLVAILISGLAIIPLLLQYQCLDCGGSGRLSRWRKHVCHSSVARRDSGRRRRLRGPTPPIQVLIWLWVMIAAALTINAFEWPSLLQ